MRPVSGKGPASGQQPDVLQLRHQSEIVQHKGAGARSMSVAASGRTARQDGDEQRDRAQHHPTVGLRRRDARLGGVRTVAGTAASFEAVEGNGE